MKKNIITLFIPLLFLVIILFLADIVCAQQIKNPTQNCSTKTPAEMKQYSPEQIAMADFTINYLYVIRVYVHILRNSNGTNAATTQAQMNTDLQTMANFFKPHNICFMFIGFDYVNNTYLNNNMNPALPADVASLSSYNKHTDAIDIYVHSGFGITSTGGGNSYNIPSDFFSVVQSTNFNFYHEMGHCLGLFHTFETAMGVECPDGSNCATSGDLICDTQADFAGSQNSVIPPNRCTYTGNTTIVCNNLVRSYTPPVNNIMSYWAACYSQFTAQQAIRMRTTIANENIVNKCLVPLNADLYSTNTIILVYNEWYLAAKNEINIGSLNAATFVIIGGGNGGNANKVINAGTKITLKPGTKVFPDAGQTRFFINPLCD